MPLHGIFGGMKTSSPAIKKLLIVDDHAPTRKWIRTVLADLVGEFCEAAGAGDILHVYKEEKPQWVLMDVEMRPFSGFTATRLLKEHYPNARVLIVTNHQNEILEKAAFEAGALSLIAKEDLWKVHHILEGMEQRLGANS